MEALTQLGADFDGHTGAARAKWLAREIAAAHSLDVGDAPFQIEPTVDAD